MSTPEMAGTLLNHTVHADYELATQTGTETFISLRPNLQTKLDILQTQLLATLKEVADAQYLAELWEDRILDAQEQLEMMILDKETAEERAEAAEAEVENLKEQLAIVQVELNVLKEANSASASIGVDDILHRQLDKEKNILKDALLRLRDVAEEMDHEHRTRITELEGELIDGMALQVKYETTGLALVNAELRIDDLETQLDDVLDTEEIVLHLTERNIILHQDIQEMRITIEELETLRCLDDELEENHVDTERALVEELELKDIEIREHVNRAGALKDACADLDRTIRQFRKRVLQLQSEVQTLRIKLEIAESNVHDITQKSAAVMALNFRLQSSVYNHQATMIELELWKMDAREGKELLDIVQPYLPQIYVDTDENATRCYLLFQRLGNKADLIANTITLNNGLPESLKGSVSDELIGVCNMRGRIYALSILCQRFAAIIRRCDVDSFLKFGRLYPEFAPAERKIDLYIDSLMKDELDRIECVDDIVKLTTQFGYLVETYFDGFELDLAQREIGYIVSFDSDLDLFAASIGFCKTLVTSLVQDEETILDLEEYDIEIELSQPLQRLMEQYAVAKALSQQLVQRMKNILGGSTALGEHLVPKLKALSHSVAKLANFSLFFAQQIMPHLDDVRANNTPFELMTIMSCVKQSVLATVTRNINPWRNAWEPISQSVAQLVQEEKGLLRSMMEHDNVIQISGISPWTARVEQVKGSIKDVVTSNLEAKRQLVQLNGRIRYLELLTAQKDRKMQELVVKNTCMRHRVELVKKQAEAIREQDGIIVEAKRTQRALQEALDQVGAIWMQTQKSFIGS
ncbi:CAP-Gly domain-containing protein [Mycena indigotica]|uniref:CAP-Gly domain-containing protein n=1 Tax=Mycena indigotica TaxID=2126181 RepID=A0A8H6W924_9AGAR|nr:CAP-Gly domain-containing protein [Mycena indigotica]KAF7307576.1 CAP-Gly domain-containing protein [Mycena indigotica]